MKKTFFFMLFAVINSSFFILNIAFAQSPLQKKWDYRFGGSGTDLLRGLHQTKDGGYILIGSSWSGISGDKTEASRGISDYWIVKTDSLGNKQWDKRYGGVLSDILFSIQQTSDGGYILGGYSSSGISGDKTQPGWGNVDYWIVKIDSLGTKQWDKDFGGTNSDELYCIRQTTDGGYILGGQSLSGIGGDKTQGTWGSYDYWIVKIDSLGTKQWDKDFGGNSADELSSLLQTNDGGYLLSGYSSSGISGDKTQNTWGSADYWVIKIDSLGTKQWDSDYGGTINDYPLTLESTTDKGFLIGGYSASGIGGNKTQANWGNFDYWIVKIDSIGTKQWDRDFGGSAIDDVVNGAFQTLDGGYFICGNSYSQISGDKTESNLGSTQAWVVKTDSLGIKEWDKTIFTSPEQKVYPYAVQTKEGCYSIAIGSWAGIAGDKTQRNRDTTNGSPDYWIIKFCDSTGTINAAFIAPDNICPGTCIDFTNLSVNATSYQWTFSGASVTTSTDINPTGICYAVPGNYDVQLIATSTTGSDTLLLANYITVYPTPPPQAITQSGDTLFANAGATSYQWYFNANLINGATDNYYIAPVGGDYNVVATDANGCEVEAAIFNVVAEIQLAPVGNAHLAIFPNPVEDLLAVKIPDISIGSSTNILIYNLLGERIYWAADYLPIAIGMLTVDCRLIPPGIYSLEVTSQNKIFRTMFIKK